MGFAGGSLAGITRKATTGLAGFALVNGTPDILSWQVPNDGQMHSALIVASVFVVSAETGGNISVEWTGPAPVGALSRVIIGGGVSNGLNTAGNTQFFMVNVTPGSVVTITQASALTAGAADLWAEIWGS